ncbi:MAG TPA: cell division protein ZapA [Clostridia bacterium]
MTPKNKVEIRIAGKDYTLVGIESEEYIQRVGLYIDRKTTEIMRQNSRLSTSMAAVLTSINVADDFFKSYEREQEAKNEVSRLMEELEKLKEENRKLTEKNEDLDLKSNVLMLDLAKREAELAEVRNAMNQIIKPVHGKAY